MTSLKYRHLQNTIDSKVQFYLPCDLVNPIALNLSMVGIKNARVFPEPVRACTKASDFDNNTGSAWSWMVVRFWKPKSVKVITVGDEHKPFSITHSNDRLVQLVTPLELAISE